MRTARLRRATAWHRPYRGATGINAGGGVPAGDACVAPTGLRQALVRTAPPRRTTHASPLPVCARRWCGRRRYGGRRMRRPYRSAPDVVRTAPPRRTTHASPLPVCAQDVVRTAPPRRTTNARPSHPKAVCARPMWSTFYGRERQRAAIAMRPVPPVVRTCRLPAGGTTTCAPVRRSCTRT